MSQSVHTRLLRLARDRGVDFNLVLQRYGAERFLYRLSVSDKVDRFILKGAALFRVWGEEALRPTPDIDLLALGLEDQATLHATVGAICKIPCPEDGVEFDPATTRMHHIRGQQPYGGVRMRMKGNLGQALLHLQLDFGFGDVITPDRDEREYPTLLDLPVPRLWTYPRETLVAEKLEALVRLDATNTRAKDLWDIACLARRFAFDGETLRTAIEETFRRRRTSFAGERPLALLPGYYEDGERGQEWQVLQRQVGPAADGPTRLADVGQELGRFLGPVCDSLIAARPFTQVWSAPGPWRAGFRTRPEAATGD